MSQHQDPLAETQRIIADFPETSEKISHGSPTFWGGKKTFASFHDNHHSDGRVAIWCKASLDEQEGLVTMSPELFFVPPYVGHRGWVGIRVDGDIDWGLVADILEQGYRSVAPKRALEALESR